MFTHDLDGKPRGVDVHDAFLIALREFGLKYPGAHYESPWPGHLDLAVNDETFVYLSLEGEPLGVSCELPRWVARPAVRVTFHSPARSCWSSGTLP